MGSGSSKPMPSSIVVAPGEGDNGAIRRNPRFQDKLVATAFPDVTTLYEAFQRGLRINAKGSCLGYRPMTKKTVNGKEELIAGNYKWFTYQQCQNMINKIGAAILHLEMAPKNELGHQLVGLFSKNRYEWVIAEQACHAYSLVEVPLYDTLGAEATTFIIGQTQMSVIFADTTGVVKLLNVKKDGSKEVESLKHVVSFDAVTEEQKEQAAALGLTLRTFEELLDIGAQHPKDHIPPKADDLAFICYTSGTTGMPKGAMISHRNMVADACSAETAELYVTTSDVHLSYLPLAHVFERLLLAAFTMAGAAVGFYQGNTLKILEDIKALRPTIFPSVPRLYNRIYDKVMSGAREAGGVKAALFNKGYEAKRYWLKESGSVKHAFWDNLVFKKVAARTGLDRVRFFLSGSAPIAPHVIEFLRIVFSTAACEGYGQTECAAAASLNSINDQATLGHVGGPLACNEIKLVSVPDMGYSVEDKFHGRVEDENGKVINPGIPCDGRGEVCYRGHNIFMGYYKDQEKTDETLDKEGWCHSGDIGLWDAQGNLRIIDRKKNIFKLSQGEYVAAEKIENIYIKSDFVMQNFVYGDSLHATLVGIVVPDPDALNSWAKENGKADKSLEELCADEDVNKAIMASLEKVAKEAKLAGFEKVKAIHVEANAWTPEDILTPTFKIKRADAKKKYASEIDAMYAKIGDLVAGKSGLQQGAVN